jgi:hypothetical protein
MISPYPNPHPQVYVNNHNVYQQNNKSQQSSTPRIVNYLADLSGCGHWRVIWPEYVINSTGLAISHSITSMVRTPDWYRDVKCVRIQRQASTGQREFVSFLASIKKDIGFKLVYEIDDVIFKEDIPDYNKFKFAFDDDNIRQNCIDMINMCDEATVTCDFMKQLYVEKTGKKEITVVPNFVPNFWIGNLFDRKKIYDNFEANKRKPRILYTGSGAHFDIENKTQGRDDFEQVLKFIIDTRSKYTWVFMGSYPPPLKKYIEDGSVEFHGWQSLLKYPYAISQLNIQAQIAPLQDNNFNRSKSDIKFIEAAILGIPCLCQDMITYSSAPDSLRFKTVDEFAEKLDAILNYKNKSRYFKNVDLLRKTAEDRLLELPKNIGCHMEIATTPYGSHERKYLSRWNS